MRVLLSRVVLGASTVVAFAGIASAGRLAPPPGPVTPTMVSLDQIEPRRSLNDLAGDANSTVVVSQPGQYFLSADLVGEPGKHGVRIATTGAVSIVLNGFSLVGVPGSLNGIDMSVPQGSSGARLHVRCADGSCRASVRDWGGDGVHTSHVPDVRCQGFTSENNGGNGLAHLHAEGVVHRDVAARNCLASGFFISNIISGSVAFHHTALIDCHASTNFLFGMHCDDPADGYCVDVAGGSYNDNGSHGLLVTVSPPNANQNAGSPPGAVRVSGALCVGNGADGVRVEVPRNSSTSISASGIVCAGNTGDGMACVQSGPPGPHFGAPVVVGGSSFVRNGGNGLRSENPLYTGSSTYGSNALYGMSVSSGDATTLAAAVADCVMSNNSAGGALCGPGRFANCRSQVSDNGGNGLEVIDGCLLIEECSITANAGAGAVSDGTLNVTSSNFRRNGDEGVRCINGECVAEDMVCEFNGSNGTGAPGADFIDCPSVTLRRCVFNGNDGSGARCRSSVGPIKWMSPESISKRNGLHGFDLDECVGAHLDRCTTSGNAGAGFQLGSAFVDGRVEACSSTDNAGGGVIVLGPGNLVVRCRAQSNPVGAFLFAPGNSTGTVINPVTLNANTNPNANIEF